MYVYIHIYVSLSLSMCIYIYIYMCACVYNTHMCVHTHIIYDDDDYSDASLLLTACCVRTPYRTTARVIVGIQRVIV